MKSSSHQLPKFVEYGPQGVSGEHTRLRFRSDPSTNRDWRAELRANLDAPRPTPQLDAMQIRFDAQAFLSGLGPQWRMLPHARGALFCCQQLHAMQLFHLELVNVGALYFRLEFQPVLKLFTGPNTCSSKPVDITAQVQASLPVAPSARQTGWRLHYATIFEPLIDAGWNLPIPRAPGVFQLKEHQGDLMLAWSADATASDFQVPKHHIDAELADELHAYETGRIAATTSLLSAASIGDARGAWLAMHIASAAASLGDLSTLRVLRVTHQRAVERGRQELGTIATLIIASTALGDLERALSLVPVLESRIGADLKLPTSAGWVGAHLRNLLIRPQSSKQSNTFHSVVTPAGGTKPLEGSFDEELLTPLPAALQSTDNELKLSPVGRARLDARLRPADTHTSERAAGREPSFALARQAFAGDDDQSAWSLIQQAVDNGETVDNEETGTMVLRLVAKFGENLADALAPLAAIRPSRVSPDLFARASQQRAEKLLALGRLDEALDVTQQALEHVPDSILLRIVHAKALGFARAPAAVQAWKRVLDHPNLEPWEAHRYRKQLAELLEDMDQRSALLHELRALHVQDPGNVQLTQQLAGILEERSAIDEAIIVRSRHAASIASLRGYPSVALLVRAVSSKTIDSLQGALAAAQAIHLATAIAHPAAWLQRALLELAEQYQDPLILEYALIAAEALQDTEALTLLQAELKKLQVQQPATTGEGQPSNSTQNSPGTPAPDQNSEKDASIETEGTDSHFELQEEHLASLLESFESLYPSILTDDDGDELAALGEALSQSRPSNERAELLGRRAVVLLAAGQHSAAAQAWTGAMILQPNDPRALAGLTIARALNGETRAAASSREHLLEEIELRAEKDPDCLPEALLRIAARIS